MEGSFFAMISRMRNIRRWCLMRNSYDENIQEHSHMAAVIAHALALIRREVFHKPADPEKCAAVALFHDASEIITGDLPTPVKYLNPDITHSYKDVERMAENQLLDMLPSELRGAYEPIVSCDDGEVNAIVKAADKLSAYIKCVEELKAGNGEFKSAEEQIRKTLEASKLEEVGYFMKNFLPAFGMTLDELTK